MEADRERELDPGQNDGIDCIEHGRDLQKSLPCYQRRFVIARCDLRNRDDLLSRHAASVGA